MDVLRFVEAFLVEPGMRLDCANVVKCNSGVVSSSVRMNFELPKYIALEIRRRGRSKTHSLHDDMHEIELKLAKVGVTRRLMNL